MRLPETHSPRLLFQGRAASRSLAHCPCLYIREGIGGQLRSTKPMERTAARRILLSRARSSRYQGGRESQNGRMAEWPLSTLKWLHEELHTGEHEG